MGDSIVVTSGKGGVGKTTTTANIGTALAKLGKKVVLVDGDTGLRNLDVLLGLENRIIYTIIDALEGRCKLKQALVKDKKFPNNLCMLPTAQTRDKNDISKQDMEKVVGELRSYFDFIIIDCPAGIEQGFENAVVAADRALVIVNPEITSVRDSDRVIGKLDARGMEDVQLIINRLNYQMTQNGEMLDVSDILDSLAIKLIGVIPDDRNITISTNRGEPIVLDENSLSGRAFMNVARRLLGENIPLEDLNTNTEKGIVFLLKKLFGIK